MLSHLKYKTMEEFIKRVKSEIKEDIKHTTYYVDRPIKLGDPRGGSKGECIKGLIKLLKL